MFSASSTNDRHIMTRVDCGKVDVRSGTVLRPHVYRLLSCHWTGVAGTTVL